MKKKFFAIYALIGAMAASPIFTSCVDSEETPSVEALRKAKAEELKAIADLNNAQAASKTAMAAADAALLNAQAEAIKAAKKLTEAQTAWYETQNESERAALEVTIKQAEADLARIQGEIDAQAIAIQAALMNAQKQLLQAMQDLEDATKDYDAYEKAKLETLAQNYADAVSSLQTQQQQLILAKTQLAKLEAGLVDAETALEITIAQNNKEIELNNIQIEAYKKFADYTENTDELYKQYLELSKVSSQANNELMVYWDAYDQVNNRQIDVQPIYDARDEIYEDEFYRFAYNECIYFEDEDGTTTPYNVGSIAQYFNLCLENEQNTHKYGEEFYTERYIGETRTYEYEMTTDIRKIEIEYENSTSWRKSNIKNWNEDIKAKETELATAVAATTAAKKAWDEAAEADKAAKKQAYEDALDAELVLKQVIENLQSNVEYYTKRIAAYDKALDMAKNADKYFEAFQAKVKAYNDANVAVYAELLAAWDKWQESQDVYFAAAAEASAASQAYSKPNAINNSIKSLESSNESLQAEIEEAKKLLTQYNGYEMPFEVAIEFQKAIVAAREAVVAAYEVKVNEAKEALDAAMPAEEEETPAE